MKPLRWILTALTVGLALVPIGAQASLLYISEYIYPMGTRLPGQSGSIQVVQIAQEPSTDQSPVDFSGGAASSATFAATTTMVRLWCDVQCSIKIGTSPTATNANKPLSAGAAEYFAVPAGAKVSVIANP